MFHYAGIYRQVPTYWNKPRSLNCVPDNCDFSTPGNVPKSVSALLAELIAQSPYKADGDLVFHGKRRDIPVHARAFIDASTPPLGP